MDELVDALRAAGCVFAEDEAALLRAEARSADALSRMVAERVAGVPLEQVLGWADFCGQRIRVAPGVFVPRRRTAHVVDLAAAQLQTGGVVVDLCCGSGAIAAVLEAKVPGVVAYAADVDPAAVACAVRNLSPSRVFQGDLYDALPDELRGRVDVLAVNAPYVPTDEVPQMPPEARDYEPLVALDGGADGLAVHRRVVAGAADWLAPGGVLVVETSRDQAAATWGLFGVAGLDARIERDAELAASAVIGRHRH